MFRGGFAVYDVFQKDDDFHKPLKGMFERVTFAGSYASKVDFNIYISHICNFFTLAHFEA